MVKLPSSALLISALSISVGAQQLSEPFAYSNITSLLDAILARGYINVGTTGDYKPFTYLVTNQTVLPNATAINTTYIGADIDAAQSLSNALGLRQPPRLVTTVWANITSDLSAMGGVSLTLARARTAFFSTAIQRVGKTARIRCADANKYTNLASLDQAVSRLRSINPGGTNEAFDRENLKNAKIVLAGDNNAVYQAVLDGTADAMISDLIEVELQARLHEGELCIANPDGPFNFEELGYAIPRCRDAFSIARSQRGT